MKEFALKHPFLTFLMVDAVVSGVLKVVAMITGTTKTAETTTKEDTENESSGDIQNSDESDQ